MLNPETRALISHLVDKLVTLLAEDSDECCCRSCCHAENFRGCWLCTARPDFTLLPYTAPCIYGLWERKPKTADKEVKGC